MKIYIPTLGRATVAEQRAYAQLEEAGLKPTLVVDGRDQADYSAFRHVRVAVKGIAAKRQAIVELAGKSKFCMIDDDITLSAVGTNAEGKYVITSATPQQLCDNFWYIDVLLDKFAHGGVHTRHFVNYAEHPYEVNRGYPRQVMFYNPRRIGTMPKFVGKTAEDVRFFVDLLKQKLDYFIYTGLCMVEKRSKALPSHFTQEGKNVDMAAFAAEYAKYARPTKDGQRFIISYSRILKDAKAGLL